MIVYLAKFSGGSYEDMYEYTLGIYDDLDVAKYECMERMKEIEGKYGDPHTDEFEIEQWELNFGYECTVCRWCRAKGGKYGHFIPDTEWEQGVTEAYDAYEEDDEEEDDEDDDC